MITSLLLTSLATYGLAYMITKLDGAADIFVKLRRYKLFQCFYCVTVWLAPLVALLHTQNPLEWPVLSLATIGATYVIYELANPL